MKCRGLGQNQKLLEQFKSDCAVVLWYAHMNSPPDMTSSKSLDAARMHWLLIAAVPCTCLMCLYSCMKCFCTLPTLNLNLKCESVAETHWKAS